MEILTVPAMRQLPVIGSTSSAPAAKASIAHTLPGLNLDNQVQGLHFPPVQVPDAAQVESLLSTEDWTVEEKVLVLDGFKQSLAPDERERLAFDPGAWEKHVNVLIQFIIAQNVARQVNATLEGVFIAIEATATQAQAEAIEKAGMMQMYSAIASGAVVCTVSSLGTAKSLQGMAGRHHDVSTHKKSAMDAQDLASDLRVQRHDLEVRGNQADARELAWFDSEIAKAKKQSRLAEWNSAMSEQGNGRLQAVGQQMSTMAGVLGQALGGILRTFESSARAEEARQQAQARLGKGLADETGQKDAADASLLNKLMELFMQIMQSRAATIKVS
ncbi:hypothetical protein [Pseudomonas rubra]|uniref:Uncharacterized protein n=1 Tax=Pseudomonas rubra TaxID=2942627 RepID=A0ABT5PCH4_9PSED|nr:hypothetical protein [Pseudomonas rubra]MDD1016004.1 hypothetical protein [Pseudomonas rubra]MDD1039225.1 hypothetical protein [Pseudomonas rubra]MDD1155195.1 hypothetical protein [Pseudomonas rubra]